MTARPVTARLFAAVDLPTGVRDRLARFGGVCAERDPALRPVRVEGLHVTLAFLGHRPPEDVVPAVAAVRAVTLAPSAPSLALADPLWLAPRRPHVLTVALDDRDGALGRLQGAVVAALASGLDWTPERRAFRAHVTVARVRHGARPRRRGLPEPPTGSFAAVALTLYRSHLGSGPARYEALVSLPLD